MSAELTLWPLTGCAAGASSRILRFALDGGVPEGFDLRSGAAGVEAVVIRASGVYALSASVRLQMFDEADRPLSCGVGITRNSTRQAVRNPIDMPPAVGLAKALLHPSDREVQRAPIATLAWVGALIAGDELRVETERDAPRLYQGVDRDAACWFRVERLS